MRVQDKFDILLFDGVCNLCNGAVDFVIRRDKKSNFKVAALQDDTGKTLLSGYDVKEGYLDSIVLVRGDVIYYKSRAALEVAKKLNALWPLLYCLIIIPRFVRDPIYDWIAKNRYRWFGQKDTCRLPTAEEKAKFLQKDEL